MVGFGYKQAWLAVKDADPVPALPLRDLGEVTWRQGVDLGYGTRDRLLVTPTLGDGWRLVFGRYLLLRDGENIDVMGLSETLGVEVQYFASHRVVDLHIWRRAVKGILVRDFGYLGETGRILRWSGDPDATERSFGIPESRPEDGDLLVGEQDVMSVAGAWSVDPTALDGRPAPGPLRAYAIQSAPGHE